MIIYFYLFIPLLFSATDSSSIRGRNNKNDLVPFMSSRSELERRDGGVKAVGNEPFFLKLLPNSGVAETGGKDKKKKQPGKKRTSKIKDVRKRQRARRELQKPKEFSHPLEIPKTVNLTERLQNLTNAISRGDILKALSIHSKRAEKRSNVEEDFKEDRNDHETGKHSALNRNHPKQALSEQTPLVKMVYPSTPKSDSHPHKYTYRDLITDRERLEQKINYIKNMLNVNDSVVDDAVRVRRRSDSDRVANKMAKMFLTLSAVNGLHDRRKSKCEKDYDDDDDDNRVHDVWEKERKESPSRKRSSSNEQRYKVKKWIEFMKNKRSSGKTCPCMASYGEERDVFPLEQKLPKGYFLMERRESSEESSETYRDPMYPPRDYNSRRRLSKTQEDQDSKLKGPPKNGKKKPDMGFTDLELYRSRAKQILRNAEEILDRIKEEEEKRLAVPNLFMSQLRELTSRIQGDPRSNENDLIRKLQKNLGWGPLARSEEGDDGNQFMENVKSFILDPYEKAKALTDESTKRLSSYLLRNLGKIQEVSEEQTEAREAEDNLQLNFGRIPPKEDEKPLPDSLTKESEADPDAEKTEAEKEETYKQKIEDIIKEQQKILDEYKMTQDLDESRKEMERGGDKAPETVREQKNSNLEDKVALQLKEHDTDRNPESREKAIERGDESEKVQPDFVEEKTLLHSEGTTREEKGGDKGTSSGNMQTEENVQEEKIEEFMKAILEDSNDVPDDQDKVEMQKSNHAEDSNAQTEDELIQMEHDSENAGQKEMQEVIASSQTTSGETSVRDENHVVSSPHLTAYYDFIDAGEKKEDDPSGFEEETPTGKDSYVQALEEGTIQAKSNDETVLETQKNLENKKNVEEPGLNLSKEPSNPDSTETVALQEPVLENSMERTQSRNQEGNEIDGAKQYPEYADLVKEVSQASAETSKIDISDASPVKSNEEMRETDETLKMEQLDDEDKKSTADRTDRANKDGETLLKLASDIQDSENMEEDPNGTLLGVNLDENSEELETEKGLQLVPDNQERQSTEIRDEIPLKAGIFETPRQESSEETLLEEAFKNLNGDEEVSLRAEKPTEEVGNQELAKSADEDNNDGTFLKEAKETQNSEEIPLLSYVNNDEDETGLREESFEGRNNSNEKESEEVSDGTALKAVRDEGLEEDVETLKTEGPNMEDGDDSKNLQEVRAKANLESEETLQSEYVLDREGSQEKKESSLEIKGKETPEDSEMTNEENEKLEEFIEHENDNSETLFGLDKELKEKATQSEDETPLRAVLSQENLEEDETLQAEKKNPDKEQEKQEDETALKVGDPKESSNEAEENDDADEATLRAEKVKTDDQSEETSREVQTSSSQENLEERSDETKLQEANPEDKTNEEQNSNETLKSTLENETQENEEEDETIKAENPEGESPKFKEQFSDENGDDESVKAVLEDHEEQESDVESVKAEMENVQDTLEDGGSLKSEHFLEEVQDDNGESVKTTFDEDNLKSIKSEENSESDGVVGEALENTESADDDETVQMDARSKELKQDGNILEYEGVDENEELKEKATQTEDETPLRAVLSQENLEEGETLQAENPIGEEEQKESSNDESQLRNVSVEDELDNKIDDQGHLRSSMTETGAPEYHKSLNEEILREETINNEIDEQDQTLQPKSFDQSRQSFNERGDQTFMEDVSSENAREDNDSTLRDVNPLPKAEVQETGSQLSEVLQMPEQSSKSLKGGTLKVPKSIGEIMNDLEGKAKGDITSLQNLNPDKIDHIIVKIDEAEQKNLLGSQETDCVKECACAEEMNTRSRNIGRYEIVKDFLHWMKDLQLNRVLSDD